MGKAICRCDSQKRQLQYFTEKVKCKRLLVRKTKDGQLGLPVAIAILGDMILCQIIQIIIAFV